MTAEITRLNSPIDVMYLIHKALRAEAAHLEKVAAQLTPESSLQAFRLAFNFWAAALAYHASQEDRYMTAPLAGCPPARDAEAEHADLERQLVELDKNVDGTDSESLLDMAREMMMDRSEKQHEELARKLEDVMAVLNEEIGRTRLIERTQRHLFGRVVALQISQDDHLDNEEAFVLPVVRQRMSYSQQLELARHLLIDDESDDPRWVLDWVVRSVAPEERKLLEALEAEFKTLVPGP